MNWKIAWHQVLIALLIGFALGAAFGQWHAKATAHRHPWRGSEMRQHLIERLDRKLQLTPDQRAQISKIFEARHSQMLALQSEIRPKFEDLRRSTQREIREILSPPQQNRFDELNARMEARWKERKKITGRLP